jgi:HAMP domain-containing protein
VNEQLDPESRQPAEQTGPSNKPGLRGRHQLFRLSFSTLIYALVGTTGLLVMLFANFWLGIAIMALAAGGIALYVRFWVRRQTRPTTDVSERADLSPEDRFTHEDE